MGAFAVYACGETPDNLSPSRVPFLVHLGDLSNKSALKGVPLTHFPYLAGFCHPNHTQAMDMFDLGQGFAKLQEGLGRIRSPALILGVQSDILFPVHQQKVRYGRVYCPAVEAIARSLDYF